MGPFCINIGLQYCPIFSLKRCILLFPVSLCQIVVPKITTDKANHGKFLAAWNEDHNQTVAKKRKRKKHGKFFAAWNEYHNKTMAKKKTKKRNHGKFLAAWNEMLVEQKMLISVLVVYFKNWIWIWLVLWNNFHNFGINTSKRREAKIFQIIEKSGSKWSCSESRNYFEPNKCP